MIVEFLSVDLKSIDQHNFLRDYFLKIAKFGFLSGFVPPFSLRIRFSLSIIEKAEKLVQFHMVFFRYRNHSVCNCSDEPPTFRFSKHGYKLVEDIPNLFWLEKQKIALLEMNYSARVYEILRCLSCMTEVPR